MIVTVENIVQIAKEGELYYDSPSFYEHRIRVVRSTIQFAMPDGSILTILPGFEFDEASVPWLFQWAFPKSGRYVLSSLVHDAMYFLRYRNRRFCDDVFDYWMVPTVSSFQRRVRYGFVRCFGWIYWNRIPSDRAIRNRSFIRIDNP